MLLLGCLCVGAALSAQGFGLSAGLGGNFTYAFTNYTLSAEAKEKNEKTDYLNNHLAGGGVHAFFDATYVEAVAGLLFGNANKDKFSADKSEDDRKGSDITALKLGLFGKFPIPLGGITLFPLLGVDGQIWLAGKSGDKEIDTSEGRKMAAEMFNTLWFKAGVGFDISLPVAGNKLFIRPELLYGIRLNTEAEKDEIADTKVLTGYDSSTLEPQYAKTYESIFGHGLDIRLSIGYRIF
jgi:hypothetical protein